MARGSRTKAKPAPPTPSLEERALAALAAFDETVFSSRVVSPLLRAMFPNGRLEETHGTNEAGRDLICFAPHPQLTRQRILCVQAKSHKFSTGATTGPYSIVSVATQVQAAKETGVVMLDGSRVYPDEIWVVNSYVFSEPQRRMTEDHLKRIKSFGGDIVDGEEVLRLVNRHCPDLLAELTNLAAPELVRAIATLSAHQESRAFGLRIDRSLSDFHVSARACPATGHAASLLSNLLDFQRYELDTYWTTTGAEADKLARRGRGIDEDDVERSDELAEVEAFVKEFDVPAGWETEIEREPSIQLDREYSVSSADPAALAAIRGAIGRRRKFSVSAIVPLAVNPAGDDEGCGIVLADCDRSRIVNALSALPRALLEEAVKWRSTSAELESEHDVCRVSRSYAFDFGAIATKVRQDLRQAFQALPQTLSGDVEAVGVALNRVHVTERFVNVCESIGAVDVKAGVPSFTAKDVSVPDELLLLDLGPHLLVEGPPGSGKTTLLRRLAIALLTAGRNVLFLPCANLRRGHAGIDLDSLARKLAPAGTPKEWGLSDSVLLVDGLDEAPFDLGQRILDLPEKPSRIVATTRLAHETPLRGKFLRLEVAPFSDSDRDTFFARWFVHDPDRLRRAKELVRRHPDIATHTRSPLVATILAALVERDYAPTSRNAVYNDRLDLLLERWHYAKGVETKRAPLEARLRFLEFLAFRVHSAKQRRSTFGLEDISEAFIEGLGRSGRRLTIESLVDDLVTRSGVVVRDREFYGFGHLTFQEHLVGRYLKRHCTPRQIANYLGNDWWRESLLFYAGEQEDITELISICEATPGRTATHATQLLELVGHALYTEEVAVEMVTQARKEALRRSDEASEAAGESDDENGDTDLDGDDLDDDDAVSIGDDD